MAEPPAQGHGKENPTVTHPAKSLSQRTALLLHSCRGISKLLVQSGKCPIPAKEGRSTLLTPWGTARATWEIAPPAWGPHCPLSEACVASAYIWTHKSLSVRAQGRGEQERAGLGLLFCFFFPERGTQIRPIRIRNHSGPRTGISKIKEPTSLGRKSFPPWRRLASKPLGTCEDIRPRALQVTSTGPSWGLPTAGGRARVTRDKKTQAQGI